MTSSEFARWHVSLRIAALLRSPRMGQAVARQIKATATACDPPPAVRPPPPPDRAKALVGQLSR
jgi:hypothetical protein